MQKKTLIFDFFGVVSSRVLGRWVADNLSPDFDTTRIFNGIDSGEMQEVDALLEFSSLVNKPAELVRKDIDSYFNPNMDLIGDIKDLRNKGHKTILLSNAARGFFDRIVFTQCPWMKELFDDIIISSDVRMIKPNSDIYLYALNKNNLKPEDVVFIDDNNENILGAEKLGITSILFTGTEQLKNELIELDVI